MFEDLNVGKWFSGGQHHLHLDKSLTIDSGIWVYRYWLCYGLAIRRDRYFKMLLNISQIS